ncbi:hypothetical protein JCM11491_002160 [Sporobolomyces phaffii]
MLVSQLLIASAALVLGATANIVTKVEMHTVTVHRTAVATAHAREHLSGHSPKNGRVGHRKSRSRSAKSGKGCGSSAKKGGKHGKKPSATHDGHFSKTGAVVLDKKPTSKAIHKPKATKTVSKSPNKHNHASTATKKPKSTHKTSKETKKPKPKTSSVAKQTERPVLAAKPPASLSQLAQDSLKAHNDLRAKHKAEPLSWSNELAAAAQSWTDKCVYQHGGGHAIGAGENIAAWTGGDDISTGMTMWFDEAAQYNFASPGYAAGTAHFTAAVWQSTTEIGCARTLCPSLTMPGKAPWTNGYFFVCEYSKPGNVVGRTVADTAKFFSANVLPA